MVSSITLSGLRESSAHAIRRPRIQRFVRLSNKLAVTLFSLPLGVNIQAGSMDKLWCSCSHYNRRLEPMALPQSLCLHLKWINSKLSHGYDEVFHLHLLLNQKILGHKEKMFNKFVLFIFGE